MYKLFVSFIAITTITLAACSDDEPDGSTTGGGTTADGGSTSSSEGAGATGAAGGMSSTGGAPGVGGSGAGGGGVGGGPICIGDGSDCGNCLADSCCAEGLACGVDADCLAATICLAGCTDDLPTCLANCAAAGNAAWAAYAACVNAECPTMCP